MTSNSNGTLFLLVGCMHKIVLSIWPINFMYVIVELSYGKYDSKLAKVYQPEGWIIRIGVLLLYIFLCFNKIFIISVEGRKKCEVDISNVCSINMLHNKCRMSFLFYFFWVIQLFIYRNKTQITREKPKINQQRETSLLQQPETKLTIKPKQAKTNGNAKHTNYCTNN